VSINWRWVVLLPFVWGAWNYWHARPVHHAPGVLVAHDPVQVDLAAPPARLSKNDYQITPLESFALEARVLGAERYRFDRGAEISPMDLALGWGPMSDESVLQRIDISQSGRFYFWHVKEFPIPRRDIEIHSANMHMIPATAEVERQLLRVRPGQVVALMGYLVEVRGRDGFRWRSSLTREDTGNGACELVWVEKLDVR
jgi:hypothetical protein